MTATRSIMRWRNWHRFRAAIGGYFWLPCPLCGQEFSGHEWRDYDDKVSSVPKPGAGPGIGTAICPDCTQAGRGYDDPGIYRVTAARVVPRNDATDHDDTHHGREQGE